MGTKNTLKISPIKFFDYLIKKYGESNIIFYDTKIRSLSKPYFHLSGLVNFVKGEDPDEFDKELIYMTAKDFKHYKSAMKYTLKDSKSFLFSFGVLAQVTDLYQYVPLEFRPKLNYLSAIILKDQLDKSLKYPFLEVEDVRINEFNIKWYKNHIKPLTEKWNQELKDLIDKK